MTKTQIATTLPSSGQNHDLNCPAMAEILPFSEAKARLSELADRIESQHERVVVTRHGRPSFVLMSLDDLESLEETLDILGDSELVASLRLSRQEAAEGKLIPLSDVV